MIKLLYFNIVSWHVYWADCRWVVLLYFQCRPPSEPYSVVAVCNLSVSLWEERCDFPTSAPTMYFFTSLLTFGWHSLISAFPNPPRLGSRFKSVWCNDFHFLKSTLDPRLTRRKDICCTWDQSQVGKQNFISRELNQFLHTKQLIGAPRIGPNEHSLWAGSEKVCDVLGYMVLFTAVSEFYVGFCLVFKVDLTTYLACYRKIVFFCLHAPLTWNHGVHNSEQNVLS